MINKWTLVQHSAFGYKGNPQFEQAVETRQLSTNTELKLVERSNGVAFDSYREAEDFAEKANYPADINPRSIIPAVKGTFSNKKIDGLKIYIPARNIIG